MEDTDARLSQRLASEIRSAQQKFESGQSALSERITSESKMQSGATREQGTRLDAALHSAHKVLGERLDQEVSKLSQQAEQTGGRLDSRCDSIEQAAENQLREKATSIQKQLETGLSELRSKSVSLESGLLSAETKAEKRAGTLDRKIAEVDSTLKQLDATVARQKVTTEALVQSEVQSAVMRIEDLERTVSRDLSAGLQELQGRMDTEVGALGQRAGNVETQLAALDERQQVALGRVDQVATEGLELARATKVKLELLTLDVSEAKAGIVSLGDMINGGGDEPGLFGAVDKCEESLAALQNEVTELAGDFTLLEVSTSAYGA
eukprot:COSAG01_NODE_13332_length_1600_cov_1.389740_2_plen_323_part_00